MIQLVFQYSQEILYVLQKNNSTEHTWRFFRSGGFDQVRLETAADLKSLETLDPKLWAALSCPVSNLEFDDKTLILIDTDGDGHIRVPEIIAAVNWATSLLKHPEDLMRGAEALPLEAIDDTTPEGALLLNSAKQILANLGKAEQSVITTNDTADLNAIFASTKFNGDGIVPASAASDTEMQTVIEDIITCVSSEEDRSGLPGVSQEKINQFFSDAQIYAKWWADAEQDKIFPLGDRTEVAYSAFNAVRAKIDDYFTRCQLAEFDQRAGEALNPLLTEYEALTHINLSGVSEQLAALPIAKIEAGKPLSLLSGINPAWMNAIAAFQQEVIAPLAVQSDTLTAEAWKKIKDRFAAHRAWLDAKPDTAVESIGITRVRQILDGGYQDKINALIAKDIAFTETANTIDSVDRLIRYHQHLFRLLNNFVSLREFYTPGALAIFQAGTLYIDGRSCHFCLRIADIDKHGSMANLSGIFLAYCKCNRRDGDEEILIAAAFTDGDADNVMVGRNGVFYDRKEQDWDATVIKIVEHPISVRQAFWYPYKRISKMVGEQIEKMTSAREKAVLDQAETGIGDLAQKTGTGTAPNAPFDVGKFTGIFAAIGLAIGAIGTAIASIVSGLLSLAWWEIPLVFLGIILLISGPSVLLAYLKLSKRNLAPLLDGNGWAINTRAIINIPFGTSLTQIAALPPGAKRSLTDPYAEKKRPWKFYLFMLILLAAVAYAWDKGYLHQEQLQTIWQRINPDKSTIKADDNASGATPATDGSQTAPQPINAETDVVPDSVVEEQPVEIPATPLTQPVPSVKPVNQ